MKIKLYKRLSRKMLFITGAGLFIAGTLLLFIDVIVTKKNQSLKGNILPPANHIMKKDERNFSFSAFGDTGARTSIMELIADEVNSSDDRFVIQLGDFFRYRSRSHFQWLIREYKEDFGKVAMFSTPGNHDIDSKLGLSYYNDSLGQENYWFSYGDVLFIGVDSSKIMMTNETLSWLKETLNRERVYYNKCIIFTHVPPIDPRTGFDHTMKVGDSENLYNVIKDYNISLIISGHIHKYCESTFKGIPLVVLPASGQKQRDCDWGYVRFSINDDGISYNPIFFKNPSTNREYIESFLESFFAGSYILFDISFLFIVLSVVLMMPLTLFISKSWHNKLIITENK